MNGQCNIKIIYTLEKYNVNDLFDENTFGIFLAGPISRNPELMASYRNNFIQEFIQFIKCKQDNKKYVIFNPELNPLKKSYPTNNYDYQLWEQNAMVNCTAIVFNLNFEKNYLPGLSTRCEFGQFLNKNCYVVVDINNNFEYSTGFSHNWLIVDELKDLRENNKMYAFKNNIDIINKIYEICNKNYYSLEKDIFNGLWINLNNCSEFELKKAIIKYENQHKRGAIYFKFNENNYDNYKILTKYKYKSIYQNNGFIVFYKWNSNNKNMVPDSYSSIEGVHILLIDESGKYGLLIEENSYGKIMTSIPGGAVEKGESLREAIFREVKEEISIELTDDELNNMTLATYYHYKNARKKTHLVNDNHFTFRLQLKRTINPVPLDEVKKIKWTLLTEIKNNINLANFIRYSARNLNSNNKLINNKNFEELYLN